MPRKYLIVLFFVAFVGAGHALAQAPETECPPECVTDSLEIITYYPSPYGYYEELRGDKIIVGDTDNSRINETDLPPSGTITFEPKSYAQISTSGTLYESTIYYDSFDHEFKYYDNNSSWQPLGGGGDYWKPSTTNTNDIYYNQSGNVGIGIMTPQEKLSVAGNIKFGSGSGVRLTLFTGSNPVCPAGTGGALFKNWNGYTCPGNSYWCANSSCTTTAGWASSPPTCQTVEWCSNHCCGGTCTATTWSAVVCLGN